MVEHRWGVTIETRSAVPEIPRMRLVYESSVLPPYRWEGKARHERSALFQYTLSGNGMFSDRSAEHQLSAGDGFLVNHDDAEYVYWCPARAHTPWVVLWCSFDGEGMHDIIASVSRTYGRVFSLAKQSAIMQDLMRFNTGAMRNIQLPVSESARLVNDLVTTLIATKEHAGDDAESRLIERAMAVLVEDASRLYTAGALASVLGISREHLSRVFRKKLNESPYAYIIRQKIELAKVDVRYGSGSLSAIARRYGFTSSTHFAAVFRNTVGVSPREYRQRGN